MAVIAEAQKPSLQSSLATCSPPAGTEFSRDPTHPGSHWVLALCAASSDWSLPYNPSSLQMVLVFAPGWFEGQLLVGGLGAGGRGYQSARFPEMPKIGETECPPQAE